MTDEKDSLRPRPPHLWDCRNRGNNTVLFVENSEAESSLSEAERNNGGQQRMVKQALASFSCLAFIYSYAHGQTVVDVKGNRYVDVESYNSCVDDYNECRDRLEKTTAALEREQSEGKHTAVKAGAAGCIAGGLFGGGAILLLLLLL